MSKFRLEKVDQMFSVISSKQIELERKSSSRMLTFNGNMRASSMLKENEGTMSVNMFSFGSVPSERRSSV